jgi:hypothetical protein
MLKNRPRSGRGRGGAPLNVNDDYSHEMNERKPQVLAKG